MWERVVHNTPSISPDIEQRLRRDRQQRTADNGTVCEEIVSRHLVGDLPAKHGSRSRSGRRFKVEETGPRVRIMTALDLLRVQVAVTPTLHFYGSKTVFYAGGSSYGVK